MKSRTLSCLGYVVRVIDRILELQWGSLCKVDMAIDEYTGGGGGYLSVHNVRLIYPLTA